MQNAGFKVVDKGEAIAIDLINEAKRVNLPVELGLYFYEESTREYLIQHKGAFPFNVHFNHNAYPVIDIEKSYDLFEKEMVAAKQMGAAYGIQHLARSPMPVPAGYQDAMFETLLTALSKVESLCAAHDFEVYLENTFESIDFYRLLFKKIREKGLMHLHFCFDLGHAKLWSGDTFEAWMTFLRALHDKGVKLHFHLHVNRGFRDEHLSFVEMEAMGFDGKDGVFSEVTYEKMLKGIDAAFPEFRKIFEVKPHIALENMAWVTKKIVF